MTAFDSSKLIGIGGPSGAGKTVLSQALRERLGRERCVVMPLDAYYCDQSSVDPVARSRLNFDSPAAFDWPLLITHLNALMSRHPIVRPVYEYSTHTRAKASIPVTTSEYTILEGVLALHDSTIRASMALAVYVDAPDELCLARRIERDCRERGRSRESVVRQYDSTVRPMLKQYVFPMRAKADIVLQGEDETARSVDKIVQALNALSQKST